MTDHEYNQLRRSLMAQFHQMMTEEIPPMPEEYAGRFPPLDWAPKY